MSSRALTDQLLQQARSNNEYAEAINHPFLRAAGDGSLDWALLALWLSQDRIYAAHAYPRFIGSLIAAIPFDKSASPHSQKEEHNRHILKTLSFALENVVKTAEKHGFELGMWKERKGTRDYVAEMNSVANSRSIQEGLLFLWAMEQVYLDAWSFVRTGLQKRSSQSEGNQRPSDLPVSAFVENWTSQEFVNFVDDLAELSNATDVGFERGTKIWERVVELEKEFWPLAGEEIHMQKDV
ncbi:heme oxygenase-like protein [Mycena alexandri]|uniref:Heme oxygenase-like protein n=1 Tax=Mycena alexandri TaxID=1745969 RepID=A0AAD6T0M4_9AGAR|nr:heme oxygenase-like protein [Mycena alexandri]